jgi:hypothetical protein
MGSIRSLSLWLSLLVPSLVAAQTIPAPQESLIAPDGNGEPQRKQAIAVRIDSGTIRVDGRLDEAAWRSAPAIADFIQKEPVEGAQPTDITEVRFVYDDGSLYIGARMRSTGEAPIQAPMSRRDSGLDQAEYVLVSLDTFLDRRTAYAFGVTASGVRVDRFYPSDDEGTFDDGFDPVWTARTTVDEEGWSAELWIPFSQLRFNKNVEQLWGLNVHRFVPTLNEFDYWAPVPRTDRAWASRFGNLGGLQGIADTRRMELLPYVSGSSIVNGNRDLANPFDDGRNLSSRAGADLKIGLGPNLTLETAFNPDFGQVEADPAEVNLTGLETFFTEKRAFFLEGARLMNPARLNNFFYSRRIGAPPSVSVSGDYLDYPRTSTIMAAGKITGRLSSGTSLGILGAVTDAESASVSSIASSLIETVRVVPRTAYGIARVQQEFGPSSSTVGMMASAVRRDISPEDPLAALLARQAFSLGGDSLLRFKGGEYELDLHALATHVAGEPAAIERLQRSAVHYLQRPDRTSVRLDPTRTSLTGSKIGGTVERTGGRHWLWRFNTEFESPTFNSNDVGRLSSGDGIIANGTLRFRETRPGRIFRNYSIGFTQNNEWNFEGDRQNRALTHNLDLTWKNFWRTNFSAGVTGATVSQRLTRGGPLMGTPPGWNTSLEVRSSAAAETTWNGRIRVRGDDNGGSFHAVNGGISFRPGPRWEFSLSPDLSREVVSQQYVTTVANGRPETFGNRYVFGFIDRSTYSMEIRLNYTFKPDLNLDVYGEPFAASGHYYDFGELARPRERHLLVYGRDGTTIVPGPNDSQIVTDGNGTFTLRNYDFNVRSFRSNIVLRWEWRRGSTLYLVWQQDRSATEAIGARIGPGDLFRSLGAPGANVFAIKTSFWMPL